MIFGKAGFKMWFIPAAGRDAALQTISQLRCVERGADQKH
jgi:hypothetical protein